ncbi:MAG: hypothetical protein IKL10_06290 [Clostridia bacterium]|nr:hypothetical protein [Clostridia bacterium]
MTGFSPVKKFCLSVCCAFLLLIYAPLACVVGNDLSDEIDYAQAETPCCELCEEDGITCENCIDVNI